MTAVDKLDDVKRDPAKVLFIGRLFGTPNEAIFEHFNVVKIDTLEECTGISREEAKSFDAICLGMVGTGHIAGTPINGPFFDYFPRVKFLASLGVGVDQIEIPAAGARGITVTNTPGANTEEVADTAIGVLIATVRRIPQADRFVREGRWKSAIFPLTGTLRGKTLGIYGLGLIGKAVARRADAFGIKVLYHGRTKQNVSYEYVPSVLELAKRSDILMLLVPGGPETAGTVDAAVFAALGRDGVLVNISRGTVVNESDLVTALKNGTISAAGLDAFETEPNVPPELIALDNVVLTPHFGSGTHHTREVMSKMVLDNLLDWKRGGNGITPVI